MSVLSGNLAVCISFPHRQTGNSVKPGTSKGSNADMGYLTGRENPPANIRAARATRVIHEEPAFAELFVSHLLARNSRVEADLVDPPSLAQHPKTRLRFLAVAVCSKLLT